jgi:hypothetical protein
MTQDIWLKLLTYEVAKSYNRAISSATKKIDEYKLATEDNLELKWFPFHSPEDVSTCLVSYFKKQEDERNKKEQEDRKKAMKERREKWAKIREDLETRPAKVYPEKSLEFQLGLYIGEDITRNYMPCLSVDGGTNNPIEVSEEDTAEYERIHNALDTIPDGDNRGESQQWKDYIAYRQMLYKKYLPDYLECWVNHISSINNMEDFKHGIQVSLWDSDVCSYDTDVIEIRQDETMRRSVVTIYRDKKFL